MRLKADKAIGLLAAIVDSSDDAIVSKTLDGVITSWNAGAERLFGYTAEEAIGRHISMIIPTDRRDEEASILARISQGTRIDHFDTVRRRKDGAALEISLTISPVMDSLGKIIGASKIARDISGRKRIERELLESERRLTLPLPRRSIPRCNCEPKSCSGETQTSSSNRTSFVTFQED